jgi:hypothetical protein
MTLLNIPPGLVFNFHEVKLVDGGKQGLKRRKRR